MALRTRHDGARLWSRLHDGSWLWNDGARHDGDDVDPHQSRVGQGRQDHFEVSNLSRSVIHELLVVAVDNSSAPLPYDYSTGKVPEKQVKVLGETEEMEPNAEKTIDLDRSRALLADLQCAGPLRLRHVDAADSQLMTTVGSSLSSGRQDQLKSGSGETTLGRSLCQTRRL